MMSPPPDLDRLRLAKEELSATYLRDPEGAGRGVVGVGIGEKLVGRRLTGRRCVSVFVVSKRLPGDPGIGMPAPRQVAGVPVDVQAVGTLLPAAPAPAAVSVLDAGGAAFELHCAHTVDPSTAAELVPLLEVNAVDCALVEAGTGGEPHLPCRELTVAPAEFDMTVHLYPAAGAYQPGVLASIEADVLLTIGAERRLFSDQVLVRPHGQGRFADWPSAGQLVASRTRSHAVGFVFAGNRRLAVANHLDDVLDALGVDLAENGLASGAGTAAGPAELLTVESSPFRPRLPVVPTQPGGLSGRPLAGSAPRRLAP